MPVDGLPNPHLHRLCRRCRKWFDASEGSADIPPVTGLMSFVQWSAARLSGTDAVSQWRCVGCQAEARKNRQRFIVSLVFAVLLIAAVVVALWGLGMLDIAMSRKPPRVR